MEEGSKAKQGKNKSEITHEVEFGPEPNARLMIPGPITRIARPRLFAPFDKLSAPTKMAARTEQQWKTGFAGGVTSSCVTTRNFRIDTPAGNCTADRLSKMLHNDKALRLQRLQRYNKIQLVQDIQHL